MFRQLARASAICGRGRRPWWPGWTRDLFVPSQYCGFIPLVVTPLARLSSSSVWGDARGTGSDCRSIATMRRGSADLDWCTRAGAVAGHHDAACPRASRGRDAPRPRHCPVTVRGPGSRSL